MNLFVTDSNPFTCSKEHCDVHLRKMIVETAQLLSTAHTELDGIQVAYKPTHKNHPCAVWVRADYKNYRWTRELFYFLLKEYEFRFNKQHKSGEHLHNLMIVPLNIAGSRTNSYGKPDPEGFVTAMPDNYLENSVETSYQDYLNDKFKEWRSRARPMKVEWTKRTRPSWVSL